MLKSTHNPIHTYEIGVDECARGPMFGRLYTAAVVLPKENFLHENMKDSKKIKSRKKMREISDYIKQNAISWHIDFIEASEIDRINIRQSVLKSMKTSINKVLHNLIENHQLDAHDLLYQNPTTKSSVFVIVDGNDFPEHSYMDEKTSTVYPLSHQCVEKADNTYSFVAASSILAKCAHDEYILQMCEQHPELQDRYGLIDNVGYGTKKHMEGIKTHGITQWHRKTYGSCKTAKFNPIEIQEPQTSQQYD